MTGQEINNAIADMRRMKAEYMNGREMNEVAERKCKSFDIAIKALEQEPTAEKSVQDMTELEKALLHIKTRADAWAVKVVKDALSQEPTDDKCHYCEHNFTPYKGNTGEFTEQEPCDKCVYSTKDGYCQYDDISETIPPLEPCTDAVSRVAVCEIISDIRDCISVEGYCAIIERLKKLPPVTPTCEEREKGECPYYAG